jgi:hypothetical protein
VGVLELPSGRGLLERGARVVVLGLVSMIMFSTAAALLGFDSPPANLGAGQPSGQAATAAGSPPAANPVPRITVGPSAGDPPAVYVESADHTLAEYAQSAPGADLLAVVSLVDYRTPAALHTLLGQYRVTQVFFAVPGTGSVHAATVRDPVPDVLAAFRAQAATAASQASAASSPSARGEAQAEADALRGDCACLFAAVVRAPAERLLLLRADPAVRVVDPAPPGTLDNAVTFVPVAPDAT